MSRSRPTGAGATGFSSLRLALLAGFVTTGLAEAAPAPIGGQTATVTTMQVDVELVLAVDVSFSMDASEQQVQRQGYLDALRSPEFISAVKNGAIGKVAVTYVEWGGIGLQNVTVPWMMIETEADAAAFADRLERQPIIQLPRTSISGAITVGIEMIKANQFRGIREVIDVSGDGPNNAGAPVNHAQELARDNGVIINGLPLLMSSDGSGADMEALDIYYRECVITGPGAFVIPVRGKAEFRDAIRTKIIREIATAPAHDPQVIFASEQSPKANCMAGEKLLRSAIP